MMRATRAHDGGEEGERRVDASPTDGADRIVNILRLLSRRGPRSTDVDPPRRSSSRDRWLALIPVAAFVFVAPLMLPRSTPPDDVPLPSLNERLLRDIEAADDARARHAKDERLPGDLLALGTAIRSLHGLSVDPATSETAILEVRRELDDARADVGKRESAIEELLTLRAVQLDGFLREVERFEATGEATSELHELGGAFVERMRDAGWVEDRRVLLTPSQRRVAFKLVWNAVVGVEGLAPFEPSLDEQRALYALYLSRPHPPEFQRDALDERVRSSRSRATCERALIDERRATEMWRIEKIKRLGAIDPSYPTAFALGTAYYRAGRYDLSIDAYRAWLAAHPDGPYTLRAKNHLKASVEAYDSI